MHFKLKCKEHIESYKSCNNLYVLKYNLEKYKTHKEKLMTNAFISCSVYIRNQVRIKKLRIGKKVFILSTLFILHILRHLLSSISLDFLIANKLINFRIKIQYKGLFC